MSIQEKQFHILIVDDDTKIRTLLAKFLENNNFFVTTAESAREAKKHLEDFIFDIMVLDVMMPEETGIEFAQSLRNKGDETPIIMLTALGEVENKIEGLESGVDDYLVKPFNPKELLLRINSIIKRTQKLKKLENICKFGDFEFDLEQLKLKKTEETVYLTETEAKILETFCKNINQIMTRQEISELSGNIDERSVDVQITRLRKKIELNPKNPEFLKTIRGKGYILKI